MQYSESLLYSELTNHGYKYYNLTTSNDAWLRDLIVGHF